jgi:anti-sigma B factor antagonist
MDETTEAPQPHQIAVEQIDGTTLVRLRGEIDASLRHAASEAMVAVLAGQGPLVIDTSAVTFIDSSGMAFLLQLHGVASDAGRSVDLRDPSGVVVDLLAMVGLDTLFRPGEPQSV